MTPTTDSGKVNFTKRKKDHIEHPEALVKCCLCEHDRFSIFTINLWAIEIKICQYCVTDTKQASDIIHMCRDYFGREGKDFLIEHEYHIRAQVQKQFDTGMGFDHGDAISFWDSLNEGLLKKIRKYKQPITKAIF